MPPRELEIAFTRGVRQSKSGDEDTVRLDTVLEYNQNPSYLNEVPNPKNPHKSVGRR